MKPMFSYFGSKYKLAKHYGAPQHDLVIEPFAGSAAYSLYWEPKQVILVDKNPIICEIWRYLIRVHEHEILCLPVDFENVNEVKVPHEARWLIGFWIATGCVRPNFKKTPWGKQYSDSNQCRVWGEAAKLRIAMQLKRIRHWQVLEGCYSELPNTNAHWFIDPPYHRAGHKYPFKNIDYPALASWCKERCGTVQVCEQQGADWLPFQPFAAVNSYHNLKSSGNRETKVSAEVLYQGHNFGAMKI